MPRPVGYKVSEETKRKISEGMRKFYEDPQARSDRSEIMKEASRKGWETRRAREAREVGQEEAPEGS